ncbi:MAG: DUF4178 domain-containing protein [Candidatus Kapabacteria bacterium]|nr:DUF4178 domain-containing protein [Candidatus Kapabacteria bacterium]
MDNHSGNEYGTSFRPQHSMHCSCCGNKNEIFSQGDHEIFVCQHCGSVFDKKGEYRTVKSKKKKTALQKEYACISLGTMFSYMGVQYTIVGVVIKHEQADKIRWAEYSLRSSSGDYACLAEYRGHTTLVLPVKDEIRQKNNTLQLYNTTFTWYHKYRIHIDQLYGAFSYDVLADQDKDYQEFIAPPFVVVRESEKSRNTFYLGKYLYRYQLKSCFSKPIPYIPMPFDSYHVRPHRFDWNASFVFGGFSSLIVLLFLLHFSIWGLQADYFIQSESIPDISRDVELPSFTLTAPHSLLQIDATSSVSQSWIEGDISLIHHQTGEQRTGTVVSEYYSGTDSDGSWVEDNRKAELYFEDITPGDYHLEVSTVSSGASVPLNITISVSRAHWHNAIVSILLCVGMMVLIYYIAFYQSSTETNTSDD